MTGRDDLALLDLLFKYSHIESDLYWKRNSVMLLTNIALLGGYFSFVEHHVGLAWRPESLMIPIVGFAASIAWYAMSRASRGLVSAWASDAKSHLLAKNSLHREFQWVSREVLRTSTYGVSR